MQKDREKNKLKTKIYQNINIYILLLVTSVTCRFIKNEISNKISIFSNRKVNTIV